MERTVLRMLEEAVSRWPDAPYALRKEDAGYVPVSFSGAREGAREFAAWLLSKGFGKGDAFALLAEGSPEWIVGELGLLSAGCVSVPLSIKLLEDEIPFRLDHSEAKGILTTRNQLKKVLAALGKARKPVPPAAPSFPVEARSWTPSRPRPGRTTPSPSATPPGPRATRRGSCSQTSTTGPTARTA
jgi:long-subunit acyl-CoA synthetase (AMP-forming)